MSKLVEEFKPELYEGKQTDVTAEEWAELKHQKLVEEAEDRDRTPYEPYEEINHL